IEPFCIAWKVDGTGFNRCCLCSHAQDFVTIRLNADGMNILSIKVLNKTLPRPLFLNQQTVGGGRVAPAFVLRYYSPFKFRVFKARTNDVKYVDRLATNEQYNTRRKIRKLVATHCCVPAHNETVA